jgi:hypothetical protein
MSKMISDRDKFIAREGLIVLGVIIIAFLSYYFIFYDGKPSSGPKAPRMSVAMLYSIYVLVRYAIFDYKHFNMLTPLKFVMREIGVLFYISIISWLLLFIGNGFDLRTPNWVLGDTIIQGEALWLFITPILIYLYGSTAIIRFIIWSIRVLRRQ